MSTKAIERFVAEAKRLRKAADDATVEFLEYLYQAHRKSFWKSSGMTFHELIEKYNLTTTTRYDRYKRARKLLRGPGPLDVGVEAVLQAGNCRTPGTAHDMIEQARTWEETNETSISARSAKTIRDQLCARDVGHRQGQKSLATLGIENEDLREAIAQLRTEAAALRVEIQNLKRDNTRLEKANVACAEKLAHAKAMLSGVRAEFRRIKRMLTRCKRKNGPTPPEASS